MPSVTPSGEPAVGTAWKNWLNFQLGWLDVAARGDRVLADVAVDGVVRDDPLPDVAAEVADVDHVREVVAVEVVDRRRRGDREAHLGSAGRR